MTAAAALVADPLSRSTRSAGPDTGRGHARRAVPERFARAQEVRGSFRKTRPSPTPRCGPTPSRIRLRGRRHRDLPSEPSSARHVSTTPICPSRPSVTRRSSRCPPDDIIQTTREAIRVWKTGKGISRSGGIRLVAHLIGDMHQPLHVGNAFIASAGPLAFVEPAGPSAGVQRWAEPSRLRPGEPVQLHSYWTVTRQHHDAAGRRPRFAAKFTRKPTCRRVTPPGTPRAGPRSGRRGAHPRQRGPSRAPPLKDLGPDDAKRTRTGG